MTRWTEVVLAHLYPWPVGVLITASAVSLLFGAIGVIALFRVRRMLAIVPVLQERLDTLTNSTALLTDTTESCFKALSMQLQFMQTQNVRDVVARPRAQAPAAPAVTAAAAPADAKSRQRRVVGAARRGEHVAAIAANEQLSESEVALRLHINQQSAEAKRGALLS
jgi:hypothetical protein